MSILNKVFFFISATTQSLFIADHRHSTEEMKKKEIERKLKEPSERDIEYQTGNGWWTNREGDVSTFHESIIAKTRRIIKNIYLRHYTRRKE